MTAIADPSTDTITDEHLEELANLIPRCELSSLSPLGILFRLLNATAEMPECGQRARWVLHFTCGQPDHPVHKYLTCDEHHDLLIQSSAGDMRWEAL